MSSTSKLARQMTMITHSIFTEFFITGLWLARPPARRVSSPSGLQPAGPTRPVAHNPPGLWLARPPARRVSIPPRLQPAGCPSVRLLQLPYNVKDASSVDVGEHI